MRVGAVAVAVFILAVTAGHGALAAEAVGLVERVKGVASATLGALSRPLMDGSDVFEGDKIVTGPSTRLRLKLNDGTTLTLGDNSTILIELAGTGGDQGSILELIEGVFLAATGAVASLSSDSLTVKTPSAILGVRGTTIWGEQKPGQLGICLLAGTRVTVTTAMGTVILDQEQFGSDIVQGQPPSAPKRWSAERLAASGAKVAFE
jgi:ferric-dicitrate binding protein FerR (iron transport regulator)